VLNQIRVSKHFSLKEFECRHCKTVKLHPTLLRKLELLRNRLGRPIYITSGYRCRKYNKKISGAQNSYHLVGMAADIIVIGYRPNQLAKEALAAGFSFAKPYSIHTHVDVRGE